MRVGRFLPSGCEEFRADEIESEIRIDEKLKHDHRNMLNEIVSSVGPAGKTNRAASGASILPGVGGFRIEPY